MSSETLNPWVQPGQQQGHQQGQQATAGQTNAPTFGQRTGSSSSDGTMALLAWRYPAGMWGLSVINFVLRIVTLGIYSFWGRTEVRQRLWASVRFKKEPLVYTGTGQELLFGFLIIFVVVLLPILLLTTIIVFAFGPDSPAAAAIQLAIYFGVFLLIGMGIYRAQRYRLSRTTWRGIRGSLTGNSATYAWTHFWTLLLILPTLGWIVPWRSTKLQGIITSNTHFGDRAFQFSATAGPLYKSFAVLWLGVAAIFIVGSSVISGAVMSATSTGVPGGINAPTPEAEAAKQLVGLTVFVVLVGGYLFYLVMGAWYRARMINHFADATTFEGGQFTGRVKGLGLLWIDFSNLIILLFGVLLVGGGIAALFFGLGIAQPLVPVDPNTGEPGPAQLAQMAQFVLPISLVIIAVAFTLFSPVTQARSMGYLVEHLSLDGHIPVEDILQSTAEQSKTGEGLAQAFDVDGF
ncbi:MAG: DUF898 family protein [Pseudomonadota bacterium]